MILGHEPMVYDSFPIGVSADSCPAGVLISVLRREQSTKFITYYTIY